MKGGDDTAQARRKKPIPKEPAERLKQLLKERGLKQSDLCRDESNSGFHLHRSELSELCNAVRPLTEEKAQDLIIHFFPDVCLDWLMGRSDIKTQQDKDRAILWDIFLTQQEDQQKILCLEIFMKYFGYNIEEYPKLDKDMPVPDLRRAMQIVSESGGITYRIYKDEELIRELSSQEMINLINKIGRIISPLLEP